MQLRRTMRLVLTEHDWWQLPGFALGMSAGGAQALILAARFPLQVPKQPAPPCECHGINEAGAGRFKCANTPACQDTEL